MADNTQNAPAGVLLLGSIPLSSADEVFKTIPAALPNRLYSIPDGETGSRYNWIGWQLAFFPKETLHRTLGGTDLPADHPGTFTLDSVKPSQYDDRALESYKRFVELREQNIIPQRVRFQVSLPSPYACIQGHLRPEFHAQLEPLYERRILESLTAIIQGIPVHDLALQWDLCFETTALEYDRGRLKDEFFKAHFKPVKEGFLDRIQRICADIPTEIPVGFHLCYGDLGHKHFIEPEDLGLLVDFANGILERVSKKRTVAWLHVPVPKERDDAAYLEPLNDLQSAEDTRLYLGVVHAYDEEGTRRRIKTAQSVVKRSFGVATECGMGRTPKEELDNILQISKDVSAPIS
ncbi:hypothetical protein BDV12DRAFT_181168 [Aspergillus spectabilis]